mmetsp:Transcript_51602/g.170997  ORF Transcript_51602/g.170997 Transcript_51602/m.170997 type:complete len:258 (+) Transcript_51602:573-1346(+)
MGVGALCRAVNLPIRKSGRLPLFDCAPVQSEQWPRSRDVRLLGRSACWRHIPAFCYRHRLSGGCLSVRVLCAVSHRPHIAHLLRDRAEPRPGHSLQPSQLGADRARPVPCGDQEPTQCEHGLCPHGDGQVHVPLLHHRRRRVRPHLLDAAAAGGRQAEAPAAAAVPRDQEHGQRGVPLRLHRHVPLSRPAGCEGDLHRVCWPCSSGRDGRRRRPLRRCGAHLHTAQLALGGIDPRESASRPLGEKEHLEQSRPRGHW